jgi:hypothetical protein
VVLRHPINLGRGPRCRPDRVRSRPARAEYFVTFDSDGQHQVDDVVAMVQRLRASPTTSSSARASWTAVPASALKKFVLRLAVLFERMSTGVRLTDAHNGLRAFNRVAAGKLRIRQNRMAHASEIVAQIGEHKLRYASPCTSSTDYSRSKGQSLWNSVNILSELFIK